MKTHEVPTVLRPFYAQFQKLEYHHDYVTVFDDFLSATINFFTPPQFQGIDVACFDKYTKEEQLIIGSLIPIAFQIFDQQISDSVKWFDTFGDFYMMLSSRGKKSALGQFFTPPGLVDMMTLMQGSPEDLIDQGYLISDPTCGSGRFLIAYHAHFPGNYVFGEDLDLMCAKMACINLMMHGCEGEIVHHDALNPDSYYNGWKINPTLRKSGLPSIVPMAKEQSFLNRSWKRHKDKVQADQKTKATQDHKEVLRTVGVQMAMF